MRQSACDAGAGWARAKCGTRALWGLSFDERLFWKIRSEFKDAGALTSFLSESVAVITGAGSGMDAAGRTTGRPWERRWARYRM